VAQNGLLSGGNVWSVAVEPSGTILAVAGTNNGFNNANLVRIDPVTGAQTLVSSNGLFSTPHDVTVGDNGVIYVIDGGNHMLITVDPVTGQQTALSLNFVPQWGLGLAALLPGASGMTPVMQSATVTITNLLDGAAESLAANTTGTNITASYNSATGVLSLTGADTPANFQRVLRTVVYNNTLTNPNITPRQIQFVVNDGTFRSLVATSIVTVRAVQIVDDSAAQGFTATNSWTAYSAVGYLGNMHYSAGGWGANLATWTFTVTPGQFDVSATWVSSPNRATNAPYTVLDGATPVGTIPVNQQVAPSGFSDQGGTWQDLGTFTLTGNTLVVQLSDNANGFVIADAVRIQKVG
jgi:hypothetical protein